MLYIQNIISCNLGRYEDTEQMANGILTLQPPKVLISIWEHWLLDFSESAFLSALWKLRSDLSSIHCYHLYSNYSPMTKHRYMLAALLMLYCMQCMSLISCNWFVLSSLISTISTLLYDHRVSNQYFELTYNWFEDPNFLTLYYCSESNVNYYYL